jgi:putative endonuclease
LQEHKEGLNDGFTKKYKINKLVYYETFSHPDEAINREKQLKSWHRDWKINLIKEINLNFEDLAKDWE